MLLQGNNNKKKKKKGSTVLCTGKQKKLFLTLLHNAITVDSLLSGMYNEQGFWPHDKKYLQKPITKPDTTFLAHFPYFEKIKGSL
jgi:hypothetical protein